MAAVAEGGYLDFCSLAYHYLFSFPLSRRRLDVDGNIFSKEPLNPGQPTNQLTLMPHPNFFVGVLAMI